MFDNARAKVRKVDRPSIWIRGRLGRFQDSAHNKPYLNTTQTAQDTTQQHGNSSRKSAGILSYRIDFTGYIA